MERTKPYTALEILKFIQENVGERGVSITKYGGHRFAPETWSVRGVGVDASGYSSLTEAFQVWIDTVKWDKERRKSE